MGRELVQAMIEADVPLDVSHLAEESFWDAMDLAPERVLASHSNARALVPGDRQLTDAMIEAVAARGGVVGLVLGNAFLVPDNGDNAKPTALADVRRHAEHVAGLVGWDRVALGSDFDGGFGVDETPREVARAADFAKLGAIAPDAHRDDVLGGTWLRFLRERVFG
jgi:membrane dipeptidase